MYVFSASRYKVHYFRLRGRLKKMVTELSRAKYHDVSVIREYFNHLVMGYLPA